MTARRHHGGFTLIELLVVVVILGILSAVVVFAVRGANDKGRAAAVDADERIVRTAEEAYCAKFGRYAPIGDVGQPDTLVGERFLSERPKYHAVILSAGPCAGAGDASRSGYTVTCVDPACAGDGSSSTSSTSTSTSTSSTSTTLPPADCALPSVMTWAPAASIGGAVVEGVSFVGAAEGWAVTNEGAIWHTINGAGSWSNQMDDVGFNLHGVRFVSATRGWVVGDGGILRTDDGGSTWTTAAIRDANGQPTTASFYGISMAPGGTGPGFAAALQGVFATSDGGATWTMSLPASTPAHYRTVAAPDPATGHTVEKYSGAIYGTRNGGANWLLEKPGPPDPTSLGVASPLSISFPNPTEGHAVGQNGQIFLTTTGGLLWTEVPSPTTKTLFGVDFSTASCGIAVGDGGTILRTTDGGKTWTADTSPTTSRLQAVSYPTAKTAYGVGPDGTVVRGSMP